MIKQWKAGTGKLILIVTLFSLISACGFHLRGIQDVSEDKKLVILTPGNTDMLTIRSVYQISVISDVPPPLVAVPT